MSDGTIENETKTPLLDPETKKFAKGNPGGPGRPKGSISITSRIIKHLEDNPEEFSELIRYYMKTERHRDLLWKMLDGMPKQRTDITSGDKPIPILGYVPVHDSNEESSKPNQEN